MDDFYSGVRYLKKFERVPGRSLYVIQEAARDKVKAYLKGLIGAEYDSDNEEMVFDASDEEEVDSDEEEVEVIFQS